eukprot:TRINITY_DN1087_c0_g1_i1.p1 TRINITY_DN1087_c0_g1~~TRINITY_DN1087_c0_g1_i1.p1  ORF type:complete len:874 (+),score=279.79 TRINITY_DN1087_c0_g1_i1:279-2900(+)
MSARHLDVLRELSEKNKEKEEQHRREEQRQQKRASSLRERILAKGGQDTDGKLSELPTLAPDETASAEEKRLWKIKCNLDIERRQHEAIQRLQELQRAKSLKKEREKLKCQWRAHKAKSYLLESCQNSGLKEYLESKEKPRALPKLPSNAPATSSMAKCLSSRTKQSPADCQDDAEQDAEGSPCTASTRPASPLGEVDESTTTGADDEAQEVQSVEAEPSSAQADVEPSAAEEKAAVTTVAPAKQLTSSAKEKYWYVNKMVSKLRNVCLRSARDLDEWKKRNGCPPEKQVFICTGGYPDFTQAMLNRGWFHNTDKDSRFFDLKWSPAANIDHDKLRPGQVINHFQGARDLTTKVGLTLNIRNCLPICSADPDEFYPRAFDLSDAAERADFVLDFKFSKAQAILVEFLRNVELRPEMTFSPDIVSLASKICMRTVTDVDDLIDCPDLAEALATITAEEWSVLEQVCLDDPTQRLEGALKKADLEDFIQKKSVHTAAIREREQKAAALLKEREKQQRLEQGLPLVEEKKKKKKKEVKSVFESVPEASKTDFGAGKQASAAESQPSTFESTPGQSKAQFNASSKVEPGVQESSVFESSPQASKAEVAWDRGAASANDGAPSTFESAPKQSVADTAHGAAAGAVENAPSTFESNPAESKAAVGYGRGDAATDAGTSVFESAPQQSTAFVKSGDKAGSAPTEAPSVFESNTDTRSRADFAAGAAASAEQNAPSTFESKPAESKAAVGYNRGDAATDAEKSVFESAPQQSTAFVKSGDKASSSAAEAPSVFESQPQQSRAETSHSSAAVAPDASQSVFEHEGVKSSAHVSHADKVAADSSTPSVFESQPQQTKAHAGAGRPAQEDDDDEWEYYDDDETA